MWTLSGFWYDHSWAYYLSMPAEFFTLTTSILIDLLRYIDNG